MPASCSKLQCVRSERLRRRRVRRGRACRQPRLAHAGLTVSVIRSSVRLRLAQAASKSCCNARVPLVGWPPGPFPMGGVRIDCRYTVGRAWLVLLSDARWANEGGSAPRREAGMEEWPGWPRRELSGEAGAYADATEFLLRSLRRGRSSLRDDEFATKGQRRRPSSSPAAWSCDVGARARRRSRRVRARGDARWRVGQQRGESTASTPTATGVAVVSGSRDDAIVGVRHDDGRVRRQLAQERLQACGRHSSHTIGSGASGANVRSVTAASHSDLAARRRRIARAGRACRAWRPTPPSAGDAPRRRRRRARAGCSAWPWRMRRSFWKRRNASSGTWRASAGASVAHRRRWGRERSRAGTRGPSGPGGRSPGASGRPGTRGPSRSSHWLIRLATCDARWSSSGRRTRARARGCGPRPAGVRRSSAGGRTTVARRSGRCAARRSAETAVAASGAPCRPWPPAPGAAAWLAA